MSPVKNNMISMCTTWRSNKDVVYHATCSQYPHPKLKYTSITGYQRHVHFLIAQPISIDDPVSKQVCCSATEPEINALIK